MASLLPHRLTFLLAAIVTASFLPVGTLWAGGIRLVDASRKVPLEYWVKDVPLPDAGMLHYCVPAAIFIDGVKYDYAKYGNKEGLTTAPSGESREAEGFLEEVKAAGGALKETEIKSDRQAEVLSGFKAQIEGEFTAGRHVLEPGGVSFTADGKGGLAAADPAFVQADAQTLWLLCQPVDIALAAAGRDGVNDAIQVSSGGQQIFAQACRTRGACVIRLYLPASKAPYQVSSDRGQFAFTVDARGVHLDGEAKPAAGFAVRTDGFTVTLFPATPATAQPAPVAPTQPELYLFTDRNRETFMEGEHIQVSIRGYGPVAGQPATLTLTSETAEIALDPVTPGPAGNGAAAGEFELETALLRPGTYLLRAAAAGTVSNPLTIRITSAMPRTNLKLFSHSKWGSGVYDPAFLLPLAMCGFNQATQGPADTHGTTTLDPSSALEAWYTPVKSGRAVPEAFRKAHLPPELLELPVSHQAGAEFMLANGIENLPLLGTQLVLYFNVGNHWLDHAENRYQQGAHLAMEWRRWPNFRGAVYVSGDGMTPATMGSVWGSAGVASFDVIHGERVAKLQEAFKAQVGDITIDDSATVAEFKRIGEQMQGAIGYGLGFESKVKLAGDDAKKVLWMQWVNDIYPNTFRNEEAALRAIVPDAVLFAGGTWGFGAGNGMYPGTLYKDTDGLGNDNHGDYGIMPAHGLTESDFVSISMDAPRRRPREVLDLIAGREINSGFKLFLEALSRNPAGIGVFNLNRDEIAGQWGKDKEKSEALARMFEIAARFGDVFMTLERADEVAVISSFRQEVTGGQRIGALQGAHYLTTKAGYQATMVTEDYCVKDAARLAKRYKALFLVEMTKPLPAEFKATLEAFQKAGGVILADDTSKDALPGVVVVPILPLAGSNMNDYWKTEQDFAPLIPKFRDAVAGKAPPFFTTTAPQFNLFRSVDGDLEYWTLLNDGKNEELGPKNGVAYQFTYQGATTIVTAARNGTLYDAFRRSEVKTRAKNGGIEFDADMRFFPGTVYLLADRPIAALRLETPGAVETGSLLHLKATALDVQGKTFTGALPIEFRVTDPGNVERYRIFRRSNDDVRLKIAANDPAGAWKVTATDQATGLVAEVTFTVAATAKKPPVKALSELVYDAPAIHDFLRKREMDIVLFPAQLPALEATARELAMQLQAQGVKAAVRVLSPAAFRNYPMQWRYETIEDLEVREGVLSAALLGQRVRGKNHKGTYQTDSFGSFAFYRDYTGSAEYVYYRDVILLGHGDAPANPLFNAVARGRMLARNPSPSFPGPDRGMVGYAWAPFHYGNDAVVVYGGDAAGLRQAVSSLVALAGAKERPAPQFQPRPARDGRENGQVYAAMGLAEAGEVHAVTGTRREPQSLLPPVFASKVRDAMVDLATGSILIQQEPQIVKAGPTLAWVDPRKNSAGQYFLPANLRAGATPETLGRLLRNEAGAGKLPDAFVRHTAAGLITPLAGGIGLYGPDGRQLWYYDPCPVPRSYEEAKYPRRCMSFALSPDGKWVLASFYDLVPVQAGCCILTTPIVALLDAATGKPAATIEGYIAGPLAVAADASRLVVMDTVPIGERPDSRIWNPHGRNGLAVFDLTGKELGFVPLDACVDQFKLSADARLAVVSYADARRYVSILDLTTMKETRLSGGRVDTGLAVAPDGTFAVIVYSDGLLRKVNAQGQVLLETALPAPGTPLVLSDGRIAAACDDGRVYTLDGAGKAVAGTAFGEAPVEKPALVADAPPPGLAEPQTPFWDNLPKTVRKTVIEGAPFAAATQVKGEQKVTVTVPEMGALDVLLVSFQYKLASPAERLEVNAEADGRTLAFFFPFRAEPQRAAVPLRPGKAGPVTLTFRAPSGVTIEGGQLLQLGFQDFTNAALGVTGIGKRNDSAPVPRVMIPNVFGLIGDPRDEQMAYAYAVPKGDFKLPPGAPRTAKTDPASYVDGKVDAGDPLYPVVFPLNQPWYSPLAVQNLRSAQVILEYQKPRRLSALGIWEQPGDLPTSAFALEACDTYTVDNMTKALTGNWRLVCSGRGNADYFHLHPFKAVEARVWRLTVVSTPALIQRLAEIELYQDKMDEMEMGLETGGAGGKAKPADDLLP